MTEPGPIVGRPDLPTGTITFLRTDVEGSMGLLRRLGAAWDDVNARHLAIVREAVAEHAGTVVRTEGDALLAVFPVATDATLAAIDAQRGLLDEPWPDGGSVRVRMGLHSGEAHHAGDDYGGFDVNRAARVAAVGHGGQIVLSGTTAALVRGGLPDRVDLRDLGRHTLKDLPLPEPLFQIEAPGLPSSFPPLRVAERVAGNLPDRLTSFVGRDRELREVRAMLDGARLVTLTGPGGIGKTSLAVEVAREAAADVRDGAWLVPLDAITDPAAVVPAVARALGLFDGVERSAAEALPHFLTERACLIVLDNAEHLLDAAGDIAALMRASPTTRYIVTSRAPLRVTGEQEYPLRPLEVATADDRGSAVSLFLERGRAARPDWDPGPEIGSVSEVCARLDGLPLGIELAAARLSILPLVAIRERLAAHLPLPGSGPRDAPTRQRTLEAAIEWSFDLLDPDDRRLFAALGVFEGGFDAEQVAQLLGEGEVVDGVVRLAEQSLLVRDDGPVGQGDRLLASGIRFRMLETVQAFAVGRLEAEGREAEVRRRHAVVFADLAEAAATHLNTSHQGPWLDRLGIDDANLHASLRHAIAMPDAQTALRLAAALWRYWLLVGRLEEGHRLLAQALAMPGADAPTQARVRALGAAGSVAYWRAEQSVAQAWYEQERELAEAIGDAPGAADAWYNLSAAVFLLGQVEASGAIAAEARRRFLELGDEIGVARIDWGLGMRVMATSGPAAALEIFRTTLPRAEALGDGPAVGMICGSIAWALFMLRQDLEDAARWSRRAMLTYFELRDVASTTISLPIGALVAIETGRAVEAATILGAHEALCERYGVKPPLPLAQLISGFDPVERTRTLLPAEAFAAAFAEGRRMSLADVAALIAGSEV